jgi:membrane-associated phospholipid phosphatase
MKSTAFKLFLIFYTLFAIGLLYAVLSTEQADLHLTLTLNYLSNFSPNFVAFQDIFFKYITELGSWIPFVIAGGLLFYKVGCSLFILLSQLLLGIVVRIIKISVDAPRPSLYFSTNFPDIALHQVDGVALHHFHSFPSGHTATVFSLMLCLTLIFSKKTWLSPIFFILAISAAYSRIYLSQHFAEDVLAGSFVGVAITLSVYYFFQNVMKQNVMKQNILNIRRKR